MSETFDMPGESAGFDVRGAWLIQHLMADPRCGFTNIIHPAAIVGNLGGESRLTAIQEVSPIAGRGGFGWEQATGSRRVNFENFALQHNWKVTDDEANYEFLIWELCDDPNIKGDGSENRALQRLKQTTTLEAAVYTFEVAFERPSSTSDVGSRVRFAQQALDAISNVSEPILTIPSTSIPPAGTPVTVKVGTANVLDSTIRLLQDVLTIAGYYTGEIDGRPNDDMIDGLQKYVDWLDSGGRYNGDLEKIKT